MNIKNIIVLPLFLTSFASYASDDSLPLLKTWQGPFENTSVYKYADYAEGVACYVLSPKRVKSSYGSNGAVYEANNVGSISCVKVTEPKKKK